MMEPLLETVDLDMEESNELAFKIKVEGTANSPAKVRLVCESSDVSYMFNGRGTSEEGVVQFVLPQMKDKLQEGTYQARVEVLIENRYFTPVQFQINFKKAVKVMAEAIFVTPKSVKTDISVSAQPVIVSKPQMLPQKPVVQPIVVEEQSRQEVKQPTQVQQPAIVQQPTVPEKKVPVQSVQKSNTSQSSLKERYVQKATNAKRNIAESLDLNDELISELARMFISSKKK